MPYRDLREFLERLQKEGDLLRVEKQIESGYEVAALHWEVNRRQGPALLFLNVKGHEIPVVNNIHGTLRRNCLALDLPPKKTYKENFIQIRNYFAEKLERKEDWLEPEMVTKAPCQEVVKKGKEVNLYELPILKWNPGDGGPYITATNVITKDPEAGLNDGMYRIMVFDERTTGLMCCATQDIGIHLARAQARGQKQMPVAVAIGVAPVLNMVATTKMASFRDSEFAFAGALQGRPVEMVKAKTVDIEVPAWAEIIIEGELDITPEGARREGPFAEWMGYYEEEMFLPTLHVTCITHRRNPIYHVILNTDSSFSEGEMLRLPVIQANNYNRLKMTVVGFRDYWQPPWGRGFLGVIQISKRFPEWGKQAILAGFASGQGMAAVNWVAVVDEDIDIYDPEQVFFAISTRLDPSRDVIVLPQVGVYPLNPAASRREDRDPKTGYTEFSYIGKMGLDATKKLPSEGRRGTGELIRPDPEAWERVKAQWQEYGLKP